MEMNFSNGFFAGITKHYTKEELKSWGTIKKTGYILLPVLLFFILQDILDLVLWALLDILATITQEQATGFLQEQAFGLQAVLYGISILIALFLIRKVISAELIIGNQMTVPSKKIWILSTLSALTGAISLNLLLGISGLKDSSASFAETAKVQYQVAFGIGLLLYGVISPIAEEILFRGILYNRINRVFSRKIAIVISAILFGLYHGNLVQIIYGILMGLLITWCFSNTEQFLVPVFMHVAANLCIYILSYGQLFTKIDQTIAAITGGLLLIITALLVFAIFRSRSSLHDRA